MNTTLNSIPEELRASLLSSGILEDTLAILVTDKDFLESCIANAIGDDSMYIPLTSLKNYLATTNTVKQAEAFDINGEASNRAGYIEAMTAIEREELKEVIISHIRMGCNMKTIIDIFLNGNPANHKSTGISKINKKKLHPTVLERVVNEVGHSLSATIKEFTELVNSCDPHILFEAFTTYLELSGKIITNEVRIFKAMSVYFTEGRIKEILIGLLSDKKLTNVPLQERKVYVETLLATLGVSDVTVLSQPFITEKINSGVNGRQWLLVYLLYKPDNKKIQMSSVFASDAVHLVIHYQEGKPSNYKIVPEFADSKIFMSDKLNRLKIDIVMNKLPNWDYEYTTVGNKYNAEVTVRIDDSNPQTLCLVMKGEEVAKLKDVLATGKLPMLAGGGLRKTVEHIQNALQIME